MSPAPVFFLRLTEGLFLDVTLQVVQPVAYYSENKELLLVENTPHGHKSFQVYPKGQYSARYFFSLTLMICRIISIRQSACFQMTVYYTEK